MVNHKDSARLKTRLQKLLTDAINWEGIGYRSASTQYASKKDILTGKGSQFAGGRWNPLGSFPTVYLSLDHKTAFAETFAHTSHFGFEPHDVLPRTFISATLKLHRILDLTDLSVRKKLNISQAKMLTLAWRQKQDAGEEALTQAIGRIAREVGFEGLLVPSAAHKGGKNIIYFADSLLPGSTAMVMNSEKLKPIKKKGKH